MTAAHLVVDVQQAGEKVAPVEPQHRREIVLVDATFVECRLKGLRDRRLVELVKARIPFPMSQFESLAGTVEALHLREQRLVGILIALPKRQLISDIPGK